MGETARTLLHEGLHEALDIALDMAPWLLLGFGLAFLCSYLLSERWIRRHLGGPGWMPIVKASVFGLPLPICSCGVLVVAMALRENGARKAPVCAFLASTPQSGTDALLASLPLLGPVFTGLRLLGAVVAGLAAGALVRWFGVAQPPPEEHEDLDADCAALCACHHHSERKPHRHGEAHHHEFANRRTRLRDAAAYAFVHLPGEIAPLLLAGVLVAAALAACLPENLFAGLPAAAAYGLAILVGLPTYACSLAIVPVAAGLLAQGMSPGAVFLFMACAPTVHVAALLLVGRKLGWRTAFWLAAGIVLAGLAFALLIDGPLAGRLALPAARIPGEAHEHGLAGALALGPLLLLFLNALRVRLAKRRRDAAETL